MPRYKVYKFNHTESLVDGSATAIRYNITHKLYDDYDTDVLAVEIETNLGPVIINNCLATEKALFAIYRHLQITK